MRNVSIVQPCRRISLIAGGTGITPCWQVIRTITDNPEDDTEVSQLTTCAQNKSSADARLSWSAAAVCLGWYHLVHMVAEIVNVGWA